MKKSFFYKATYHAAKGRDEVGFQLDHYSWTTSRPFNFNFDGLVVRQTKVGLIDQFSTPYKMDQERYNHSSNMRHSPT